MYPPCATYDRLKLPRVDYYVGLCFVNTCLYLLFVDVLFSTEKIPRVISSPRTVLYLRIHEPTKLCSNYSPDKRCRISTRLTLVIGLPFPPGRSFSILEVCTQGTIGVSHFKSPCETEKKEREERTTTKDYPSCVHLRSVQSKGPVSRPTSSCLLKSLVQTFPLAVWPKTRS